MHEILACVNGCTNDLCLLVTQGYCVALDNPDIRDQNRKPYRVTIHARLEIPPKRRLHYMGRRKRASVEVRNNRGTGKEQGRFPLVTIPGSQCKTVHGPYQRTNTTCSRTNPRLGEEFFPLLHKDRNLAMKFELSRLTPDTQIYIVLSDPLIFFTNWHLTLP
ncbi:hypothetical protein CC80DRAFT_532349 [Byssothecium circinans]|uniref:Uncharacterized protein n=1 Tax=Byssothecium circinans TaxID=147558 RepID=A0A6A5UI57_9PLEO|nr:hypothetical protein CC80DRAFT_532349 [Byssothecium circinans]